MKKFWTTVLGSFVGVWLALTVFSVLSVVMSFAFIGAMASIGDTAKSVEKNSILHINLAGELIERDAAKDYMSDLMGMGMGRDYETQSLATLIKALRAAKDNDNVKGVYIECNGIVADFASLTELRRAIADFKTSKKFVYAYGDNISQGDYYIASVADSVFVNKIGAIELTGITSIQPYMKSLLDNIGVEMQVIRVGTFKSAVEPYILNEMSEANRLQQECYLGSIWNSVVSEIAQSRKITPADINQYADSLLSLSQAQEFVDKKLADALCYRYEVENKLRKLTDVDKDDDLKLASPAEVAATAKEQKSSKNKIAVFYAVGEIVDSGDGVDASELTRSIIEASNDDDVKAVVLRVNSPGGSAFGSEQMWAALEEVKKAKKPFAVSMGGYAASGGYYISCGADRIFAEPTTITGSIGVFGIIPCFEKLATEKLAVNFCSVSTNPNATMSLMKRLTPFQRERMQEGVNNFYELFTSRCATGRHMPIDSLKAIAEGRVWDGATALKLKLVDEIGDLDAAVKYVAKKANLGEDYEISVMPDVEDDFIKYISKFAEARAEATLKENLGVLYQYHKEIKRIMNRDQMQCIMEPIEIR
ncbi:MAG: signal peptide peptidase SppA [Muribaculaceae bacterium]